MLQMLHLLIVDEARGNALVTRHGRRWLLPIVCLPERVRAGPGVLQWSAAHGLSARFVGQWLGRATADGKTIDWLAVVALSAEHTVASTGGLEWINLSSMVASSSLFDYQQWAVEKALSSGGRPSVPGPFGTIEWMRTVDAWLSETLRVRGMGACDHIVPCRATPYEIVLELHTPSGLLYFKGLTADRAAEAAWTLTVAAVAPESFARTRAQTRQSDGTVWWLMDACPGTSASVDLTRDRAASIARLFAQLQQRINDVWTSGTRLDLPVLDLSEMIAWAGESIADVTPLEDACARVARGGYPAAWIWADFDPANVIVDGDAIRFIDLDDSALGPAPIAISTFAERLRRGGGLTRDDIATVYEAYERTWPSLPPLDRRAFEIVARLIECHLAWRRVVLKTVRGEVFGIVELAREQLARRLADAIAGDDGDRPVI